MRRSRIPRTWIASLVTLCGAWGCDRESTSDAPRPVVPIAADARDFTIADVATDTLESAVVVLDVDCRNQSDPPNDLACTGLYQRWRALLISPDVEAYDPGLHLWSDGAIKTRYIKLPAGAQIDTRDQDEWIFPIGTKVWKEFKIGEKRVETRYMKKNANGSWTRTLYAWSLDGAHATKLMSGRTNAVGTTYAIPATETCADCHDGRRDNLLGFEAVSLSSPNASGLDMAALVARGLVTDAPTTPLVVPGTPQVAAALAYLHINCGVSCHNRSPDAYANSSEFYMRLDVSTLAMGDPASTDTYQTGLSVEAWYQPTNTNDWRRIVAGDPEHSLVVYRASRRSTRDDVQMPPIATKVPDQDGMVVLRTWIGGL